MQPDEALGELLDRYRSGQIELWGRRVGATTFDLVPTVELADLSFRMASGAFGQTVGLWMAPQAAMSWTSLQCRSSEVMALWPASRTKTAAVSQAILRHLEQIMNPPAALTKDEARNRCRAAVQNYYPQGFETAWRRLNPDLKRRRGQHGRRTIKR